MSWAVPLIGFYVVLPVFLLTAGVFALRLWLHSQTERLPETGIELIEGIPGAGKSYFAVRRLWRILQDDRRVVYTNLPLHWRKWQWLLRARGGHQLANLLRPLSEQHFRRFVARLDLRKQHRERFEDFRAADGLTATEEEIDAAFHKAHGPDIEQGPDANWISPMAMLVIDEIQRWYPQHKQAEDGKDLRDYLSMHRHMMHWVWILTQDRMLVHIAFRKVAERYWIARDMADDRLVGPIKGSWFGLKAIGYACFSGDQLSERTNDDATPLENWVTFPQLPHNRFFFRLYNSHTHMGDAKRLKEAQVQAWLAAGLDENGKAPATSAAAESGGAASESASEEGEWPVLGKIVKRFTVGFAAVVGLLVGVFIGVSGSRTPEPAAQVQPVAVAPVMAAAPVPGADVSAAWGELAGLGEGFAVVDRRTVRVGEVLANGARLDDVSPDLTGSMWFYRGDWWLWVYGRKQPDRLGPPPLVMAALSAGPGQPGASPQRPTPGPPAEAVGPPSDLAPRR